MIIANPLYDVVFKYLLEDVEIAKELLAAILGEDIISVELKPQETLAESSRGITVLRFDFNAVIRKKNGELNKVLVELQKAKSLFRILCRWQKQADFLSVFAFLKAHSRCYATEKR